MELRNFKVHRKSILVISGVHCRVAGTMGVVCICPFPPKTHGRVRLLPFHALKQNEQTQTPKSPFELFYFCVCLHDNNATTVTEFIFTRLSRRSRSGCLKIYKSRQRLELQYQSRKHWQTKTPVKMNSFRN